MIPVDPRRPGRPPPSDSDTCRSGSNPELAGGSVLQDLRLGRTSRIRRRVSLPGRWELLIPTNATLYVCVRRRYRVSVTRRIPLGPAVCRRVRAVSSTDATRSSPSVVTASIRYRVSPRGLVSLVPNGLRPDGLADWLSDTDMRVESLALRIAGNIATDAAEQSTVSLTAAETAQRIEDRLTERMPELSVLGVVVERLALPDLRLYEQGRDTYRTVQAAREQALVQAAQDLAAARAAGDQRISNLERYGRVLTDYPVLLEYLQIAAQNGADPLELTDLQALEAAAGE